MQEEMRLTGEIRALYVALMAVIQSHPSPKKAANTARNAIEAEIVQEMNKPGQPEGWVDGQHDLQKLLNEILNDKYPD
jgi:hypothetical protein